MAKFRSSKLDLLRPFSSISYLYVFTQLIEKLNNRRFLCVNINEYCFGIPLTILKPKTMNLSKIWASYYPVILAFLSFLYSVSLWFTGNKLEGIFVGIWVPSILGFSVAIRQIRRDTNQENKE